ncbi:hypothetical protein LMG28688_04945 [Paraburkholderia caffeinitolerans]|uniref:Uncharacterized protein n=1 Tax=Paraburkholderia caffeinitolerans TaxID=1723730 RepID=A0A6J5GF03_9BURK|nr:MULTISPECIES: hypothetical protein [Paraburkholderia]CAB3799463.1 hypothetical protein LMG28688_04945 [Paraburkholderia caffeinitolerans]
MTYAIALRIFAVMLSLLAIGLMAMIAQHTHKPRPEANVPFAIHFESGPRWPETMLRGGVLCLLASFVVLTATCILIAGN